MKKLILITFMSLLVASCVSSRKTRTTASSAEKVQSIRIERLAREPLLVRPEK